MGISALIAPLITGLTDVGGAVGGALGGVGSALGLGGDAAAAGAAAAPGATAAVDAATAAAPSLGGALGAAGGTSGLLDAGVGTAGILGDAGAGLFSALGGGGSTAAAAAPAVADATTAAAPSLTSAAGPIGGAAASAPAAAVPAGVSTTFPSDITAGLSAGLSNDALSLFPSTAANAGGAAAGTGGGILSSLNPTNLLSTGVSQIAKNPLSLLGAGGLVYNLLQGDKKPPNYNALQGEAQQAQAQAGQLESYLTSGQLPSGVQASLNSARDSAIAAVKSQYANRGMSGSSAEQQDLQSVYETVAGQGANIALNLYNTGLSQAQLSDQIYAQLMQTMIAQDTAMSSAVGNFAGSLALMGGVPRSAQIRSTDLVSP